jgi:hypothetical protein
LAALVVLVGLGVVGWSGYRIVMGVVPLGGGCGNENDQECPPDVVIAALSLFAGIGVAFAGSYLGRDSFLEPCGFLMFPAFGVGSLVAGFTLPPGQGAGAFVLGGSLVGIPALIVLYVCFLWIAGRRRRLSDDP